MEINLEGEKVLLRPLQDSDYQSIYENIQDKNIPMYVGTPYPYGQIEAKAFIKHALQATVNGEEFQRAIIDKKSGKFAGMIGLMYKKKEGPVAEIGFWIGQEFRGKGLMRESAYLILKHGFEQDNLKKIYGRVYAPNRPSSRVFERLGFKLEGRMRKQIYRWGMEMDLLIYGLLKSEFKRS